MPYPIRPFTEGMLLMTPDAVASRARHAVCNAARAEAWALAVSNGAQVLEADAVGQRAYWRAATVARETV